MLKRITSAIAALALAAPAMATDPALLDAKHERLWDTMESKGLWAYVNQPQVCEDPEKKGINVFTSMHGEQVDPS